MNDNIVFFDTYRRYYEVTRFILWASFFTILFVLSVLGPGIHGFEIAIFAAAVAFYWFDRLCTAHRVSSITLKNEKFLIRNMRNNVVACSNDLFLVDGTSKNLFGKYTVFEKSIGIFDVIASPNERTSLAALLKTLSIQTFKHESSVHRMAIVLGTFWLFVIPLLVLCSIGLLQDGISTGTLALLGVALFLSAFSLQWMLRHRRLMLRTVLSLLF